MRFGKCVMLGAALVFGSACGAGTQAVEDTEYVEALPDLSGVALEINGEAAAEEGAALVAAGFGFGEDELNGAGPELLEGARLQVKALNGVLKQYVGAMTELANTVEPQQLEGGVVRYGPADKGQANWRLTVRKAAEGRFQWKLEARPQGSTDEAAFKLIAAGGLTKGAKAHRGRGTLGVHLDNYKLVVPTATGQGKLMTSFAHTAGDDKVLSYRLVGFTPNATQHEPVTGAFVGHRLMPSKATRIRLFSVRNLSWTETAAKETAHSRIRFVPGLGGRADVLVTGGDVPADKVVLGSACWDPQEKETFRVARLCTKATSTTPASCTEIANTGVGTREACPADMRADVEAPSDDANDTTQEPGAPAEAQPPAPPADVTPEF